MSRTAFALAFAMIFPTIMAWFYLVAFAKSPGATSSNSPPFALVPIVYMAGKVIQCILPLAFFWWLEHRIVRPSVPAFTGLELGLIVGLFVSAVLFGLYYVFANYTGLLAEAPEQIRVKLVDFRVDTPLRYIGFAVFISLIHSLFEEYYWRWFIFGRLRKSLPLWSAIVVSSLAFMSHHVINLSVFFPGQLWTMALPLSLCVAVGGGVWAWLYDRTGSVYSPWISHLLVDAAILAVGYRMAFAP